MRLDKFLKVSRLIKRRTVAKGVAAAGRVEVNGRPAKPGTDVEVGDEITIDYGTRRLRVRVLGVPATARAEEATSLYEVLEETASPEGPEV
ncbi:RNA-binding S4 domain-containing protein [Caldinitratiruptor microaerophilus]|uniref:RQC P-site tRNA stabilizing factor n=1 Tax=Caldinitratiruptor microaerophilus TaxID=671077 RepID=A0AA35CQM1_9FIRM|nr:RNA-binding S4 domain-containing protein [Caldinitratiruptor microaerophilus]BDG62020.1 hypothetical protein caldi_31100 [Caldinitratiruptor microaerophilus]